MGVAWPKKPVIVCCRDCAEFLQTNVLQVSHHLGCLYDKRRLVALAAVRYRRQKRRIRLDEQAIQRDLFDNIPEILRFGKSDQPRE